MSLTIASFQRRKIINKLLQLNIAASMTLKCIYCSFRPTSDDRFSRHLFMGSSPWAADIREIDTAVIDTVQLMFSGG